MFTHRLMHYSFTVSDNIKIILLHTMDIDNLLNLERRTGVKNDDIEDFVDKVFTEFYYFHCIIIDLVLLGIESSASYTRFIEWQG